MALLFWGALACAPPEEDPALDGADQGSAVVPAGASDWCLSIAFAQPEVVLGEPVALAVELRNCSSETKEIRNLLAPELGLLSVYGRRPGEETEDLYFPAIRRDGRGTPSVTVEPGEAVRSRVPVYFGRDGWFLDEAGTYRFRAEFPVDDTYVRSAPVDLRVAEPEPDNRLAANLFMSEAAARFFAFQGGDERGASVLRRLVSEYPGTPWATYADVALTLDQALGHGAGPESSCRETIPGLDARLARARDPLVVSEGYGHLAACLEGVGREGDADRVRAELDRAYTLALRDEAMSAEPTDRQGLPDVRERLAMGAPQESQETDTLRSFAVYALSRGAGVPAEARRALDAANEIVERDRSRGSVVSANTTRLGLEGERRLCVEYETAEAAARARREIEALIEGVDLVNLVVEPCEG